MKPLLSERQLFVGVGEAVGGLPSGLCAAIGGEGGVRNPGGKAKHPSSHKAGAVATTTHPRAQHQICRAQASGCPPCHLQEAGSGG